MIWKNVQYATHRMKFDPAQLQVEGEPPAGAVNERRAEANGRIRAGRHRGIVNNGRAIPIWRVPGGSGPGTRPPSPGSARVFPDTFYMEERGRHYFDRTQDRGRLLSAGFHSLMGYFRDDQPLYELILDAKQQKELDALWLEHGFRRLGDSAHVHAIHRDQTAARRRQSGREDGAARPDEGEEQDVRAGSIKATEAAIWPRADGSDDMAHPSDQGLFRIHQRHPLRSRRRSSRPSRAISKSLLEFAGRAYRRPLTTRKRS